MTIDTNEKSTIQPTIIEVYKFTYGSDIYYMTSYFNDIPGEGYIKSVPIDRGEISFPDGIDAQEMEISIPMTDDLAVLLKSGSDIKAMKVEISRYFGDIYGDSESIYIGYLDKVHFDSGKCYMTFKTIGRSLQWQVARVRMQAPCNNRLFDSVCGLLAGDFDVPADVTVSEDGRTLTSATFGGFDNDYFRYGQVVFGDHRRLITSHTGNDITISFPILSLGESGSIIAYPGCDKTPIDSCYTKFHNLANYVGMPYVPLKNPEETALA